MNGQKFATLFITFLLFLFSLPAVSIYAQTNQINNTSDNHTAREEQEGREIWQKLQAKQVTCDKLSGDNFQALGEHYMGQITGTSHEAMNTMMIQMMGEEGEKQMPVVMGKRLSGCDPDAQVPQSGWGFMPMMWMMGGGGNPMMGYGSWGNMMGWGFGIFGWLFMIVFWVLLILGAVALIRYLARSGSGKEDKTPLEILKERYARGEIDKKEFEEKKKDL